MARELHLHLRVVVPDTTTDQAVVAAVIGRELPGLPGTWIATADVPPAGDPLWDVHAAEADADTGLTAD
jgi:hypothetical protein